MTLALYLDESRLDKYPDSEFMLSDDIIVNSTGNGTLGRIGYYRASDNPLNYRIVPDSHVTIIRVSNIINPRYVFYFLKNEQKNLETMCNGSTNQTELKPEVLKNLYFPLPPLAEQERIVAKVEALLSQIDDLEKTEATLEKLKAEFPADMKASLLQAAIQGKLTEQLAEDGTAAELLAEIKSEKEKLIKEGKIKKSKALPEITEEEIPFDIPENWQWVRMGEIIKFQSGYAYKSTSYVNGSKNQVIRLGNVKQGELKLDSKAVFIGDKLSSDTEDYQILENDLLVTMTGTRRKKDYFFIARIIKEYLNKRKLFLNQRVGCIRVFAGVDTRYLVYVLQNEQIRDLILSRETGTANQGNIGSEDIKKYVLIPLPPLAEQKRIVAKLEQLLPLCDGLVEK